MQKHKIIVISLLASTTLSFIACSKEKKDMVKEDTKKVIEATLEENDLTSDVEEIYEETEEIKEETQDANQTIEEKKQNLTATTDDNRNNKAIDKSDTKTNTNTNVNSNLNNKENNSSNNANNNERKHSNSNNSTQQQNNNSNNNEEWTSTTIIDSSTTTVPTPPTPTPPEQQKPMYEVDTVISNSTTDFMNGYHYTLTKEQVQSIPIGENSSYEQAFANYLVNNNGKRYDSNLKPLAKSGFISRDEFNRVFASSDFNSKYTNINCNTFSGGYMYHPSIDLNNLVKSHISSMNINSQQNIAVYAEFYRTSSGIFMVRGAIVYGTLK